jgi:hypothetical protein
MTKGYSTCVKNVKHMFTPYRFINCAKCSYLEDMLEGSDVNKAEYNYGVH